jgi:5-methylcytosine-specific restriction endonuclease McrA
MHHHDRGAGLPREQLSAVMIGSMVSESFSFAPDDRTRNESKIARFAASRRRRSSIARSVARALEHSRSRQPKRTGPVVEATGDLHWLEWSLPDDEDLDDVDAVKRCNPAPWITAQDLRRQRSAVPDTVIPRSEGGPDHPSNLETLCVTCHGRESAAERRSRRY